MKKPSNRFLVVEVSDYNAYTGSLKPIDSDPTYVAAEYAAQQLAKNNPGKAYAVYELKYVVSLPVGLTEERWG